MDAATGALVWKVAAETFPSARLTGSPVLHEGRLYVPVSSSEEGVGSLTDYECCRFRGSVVALDAATGRQIWKTHTIPEEPRPVRKNAKGVQLWGPSGAPIWSSPVVDPVRRTLYVTTGNNYSDPTTATSDAFMAMDLETGRILWTHQVTARDAYVSACRLTDKTNCPEANGPDFDFAASPILVTLGNGRRALVAGHKSGNVYAVDPDREGARLWETRVGEGGSMGGVQWGSAADGEHVYVALSDLGRIMLSYTQFTDADRTRGGGMFALRLADGARVWHTPPPPCDARPRCSPAQSGAVSALPGVAFAGSLDGHLRAYSASTGAVVWDYDTVRTYETVNGVPARGGSLDGPGPVIGGGMVFVNSGYTVDGGAPGNVVLAFAPSELDAGKGVMIGDGAERTFDMRNTSRVLGACLLIVTVCAAGLHGAGSDVADAVMNRDTAASRRCCARRRTSTRRSATARPPCTGRCTTTTSKPWTCCSGPEPNPPSSTAPACRLWRWRRSTAAHRSSIGC